MRVSEACADSLLKNPRKPVTLLPYGEAPKTGAAVFVFTDSGRSCMARCQGDNRFLREHAQSQMLEDGLFRVIGTALNHARHTDRKELGVTPEAPDMTAGQLQEFVQKCLPKAPDAFVKQLAERCAQAMPSYRRVKRLAAVDVAF